MSFLIYLLISQMKVTDFSVKVMNTKMAEKQVLAYLGIALILLDTKSIAMVIYSALIFSVFPFFFYQEWEEGKQPIVSPRPTGDIS